MAVLVYKLFWKPSPSGASDSPTSGGRTTIREIALKHVRNPGGFVKCVRPRKDVIVYREGDLP